MKLDSADIPVGLDLDDLTPSQTKKLFRQMAQHVSRMRKPSRPCKDEDCEDEDSGDDAIDENDDLVSLAEETRGNSRPPAVMKDDLPKGFDADKYKNDKKVAKGKRKDRKDV